MTSPLRVVVTGVESTGKTTLCEALATEFQTCWVPEYGRDFTVQVVVPCGIEWASEHFVHIAQEQQRRENVAAEWANEVLICDTNAYATGIWHELYMGARSQETEEIGDQDQVSLYILALPDFPWVDDGVRDAPEKRLWMHQRFIERLGEAGVPVVEVGGTREERLATAVAAIQSASKK